MNKLESPTDPIFCKGQLERGQSRYGSVQNDGWEEGKHPRADDGKFGAGGGGKAKAEKPAKGGKAEKGGGKSPASMSPGQIQKAYEKLQKRSSELTDKLIEAGHGTVKPTEMLKRKDENPLFKEFAEQFDEMSDLRAEAERRGGPGFSVRQLTKSHKSLEKPEGDAKEEKPAKGKAAEKSGAGPKKVSRAEWFDAVKSSTNHWDRKGPNELILWFPGYKSAEYHEAQDKLMKVGGAVMKVEFDKQSGKTYAIVREPKGLEKPEE